MKKSFLFIGLSLFLFSCTTQRDFPERILEMLDKQARTVSGTILEEKVEGEAHLPEQFSLAIYFRPSHGDQWKWSEEDKERIVAVVESERGKKIRRVFELINTGGPDEAASLRKMALQQGADALLIIQGVAEVETHFNPWALSYIAIAPAFFVEGNDVSAAFLSQAILWDTRKSYVHLGVQSEGDWSMERPALFKQKHRAIRKSKEEALNLLFSKLKKNFQEVVL